MNPMLHLFQKSNLKRGLILCCLLYLSLLTMAQGNKTYTVNGTVFDPADEPLTGVTVAVKGAPNPQGTLTDVEGKFSLQVTDSYPVITISYLGYKTEIIRTSSSTPSLHVVLKEDAQSLDEIVVVGYGAQKKSSLTSSIETISNTEILKMPTVNLDEALTGQVSGLSVKATSGDPSAAREATINIRAITGSPLLVIDGVPRIGVSAAGSGLNTAGSEMRLSDLNPDDIESISILKDAAATAVYGARAAYGVILVKTKRSVGDRKVRINYRGQFNLQQATKFPEFLDSYEYAKLFNVAVENTGNPNYTQYTDEQLEMIRTQSNRNLYANENFFDYLDDYGYAMSNNLTISGGNEFVKYYISGAYVDTKGLYSGVGKDRYNYSLKLDAALMKGLTLKVDAIGSISKNKYSSVGTLDAAYAFSPIQPLKFENGLLASISGSNPLINVDGLGGYYLDKYNMNTLNARLDYEIPLVKGLSVYAQASMERNNFIKKTFSTPVTLYTYKTEVVGGQNVETFSPDVNTVYPLAKISLSEKNEFSNTTLLEGGMNYNRAFGKHDASGLILFTYQEAEWQSLQGINENMPGIYPELLGNNVTGKITGSENLVQRAAIVGRLNYSFDNRYFVEGNFRMDGSTKFAPDNRWDFFPSASASWVPSNEPFFRNWKQDILSSLKFRGSVGVLGQDDGSAPYDYLMKYIFTNRKGYEIGGSMQPGIIMDVAAYPNLDLTMQKRTDYNIATDMGFWNNKFGITYEYFWRYHTDLIKEAAAFWFPPSVGTDGNLPNINYGKIKAWGWDLTVNHKNTINKFRYDLTFIMSKVDDEILDNGDESALEESVRRVGTSPRSIYVYQADGLFQSQEEIDNHLIDQDGQGNVTLRPGDIRYADTNNDNLITATDRIYVKSSSYTDLLFSFKAGFEYKGFFVNAMFQGVTGYNQMIKDSYSLYSNSLQKFQPYHRDDTWTPDNPDASYPRIKFATSNDNNRKESTFWIKKSDYIRLKSLSVGYSLPAKTLKKMNFSSMTIALQGGNLYTWSSLKDIDPESLRQYPVQRSYGITLNFGF